MEKYFYLNSNNGQAGPVSPTDFIRYGINEDTMIWKQGMPNWMRAGQIPELSQYFRPAAPTPPNVKPVKPGSNMVWAVLSTVFCCFPLGVYSIILSTQVDSLYNCGRYDEAQKKADEAKKWAGVGALVGLFLNVFALVLAMVFSD